MTTKLLVYYVLFNVFFVTWMQAEENQNLKLQIVYVDISEILFPEDGFFDLKGLHYYSTHSDEAKMTSIRYKDWIPENVESSPTFYSYDVNSDQNTELNAYYLRNHRFVENRKSLIDEYFNRKGSSRAWSMSNRADLIWNSAFNVNVFNENVSSYENQNDLNNRILLSYFHNDQNFVSNITVMDLSDSFIHKSLFDEIANLPKLEKLALPQNGAPLSHPLFKANENVRELVVFNTILSDDVIKQISNFSRLEKLVLVGCSADQFFSPNRNFEPLNKISEKLKFIKLLNCNQEAISILEAVEWNAIEFGVFDFVPTRVAVEKLLANENAQQDITIIVNEKHSESFDRFAKSNLMSRFRLSD